MYPNIKNGDFGYRFRNALTSLNAAHEACSDEEVLGMLTWVGKNLTVLAILSLQVLVI